MGHMSPCEAMPVASQLAMLQVSAVTQFHSASARQHMSPELHPQIIVAWVCCQVWETRPRLLQWWLGGGMKGCASQIELPVRDPEANCIIHSHAFEVDFPYRNGIADRRAGWRTFAGFLG